MVWTALIYTTGVLLSRCSWCSFIYFKRFSIYFQNVVPKLEPIDSPLTDCSGENTNDTDIAVLDEPIEKKYSTIPENFSNKIVCTTASGDRNTRKWINEVSSTQPCLNICNDKGSDAVDEDKDCIEIDKEVETVLQSGTIVESLSITTENLNSVSSEAQNCKGVQDNYSFSIMPLVIQIET